MPVLTNTWRIITASCAFICSHWQKIDKQRILSYDNQLQKVWTGQRIYFYFTNYTTLTTQQLKLPSACTLSLMFTILLTSGSRADRNLEKIISGAEVEASGHLQTGVVVEDPVLYRTVVTVLHCGAIGAILQTADGQTWLGDDVEEGVLLWWAGSERDRWWWR